MTDANNNGIPDDVESAGGNFLGSIFNGGNIFTIILLLLGVGLVMMIPGVRDWIQTNWPQFASMINGLTGGFLMPDAFDTAVMGMSDADARTQMTQHGIPAEIAGIVAENQTVWNDFRTLVRTANGGKIHGVDDFTNDKTIYALLQNRSPLVGRILQAARTPATTQGGQPNGTLTTILASVRTIFNDPTRMAVLLDNDHRAYLFDLLRQTCPIQFDQASFNAFIEHVGMENGQLTPAFKTFVDSMLTAATQDPAAAMTTANNAFITLLMQPGMEAHAAEIAALMHGATAPAGQQDLFTAMGNEKNVRATLKLVHDLETVQAGSATRIMAMLSQGQLQQAMDLVRQTPGMLPAILEWRNGLDVNALPDSWKGFVNLLPAVTPQVVQDVQPLLNTGAAQLLMMPVTTPTRSIMDVNLPADATPAQQEDALKHLNIQDRLFLIMSNGNLRNELCQDHGLGRIGNAMRHALESGGVTDPEMRTAMTFLATPVYSGTGQNRVVSYPNLAAINKFFNAVAANPENSATPEAARRTRDVTYAFYKLASGDNSAFNSLPPEEIAAFFANNFTGEGANTKAVGELLHNINISQLPAPYQRLITLLRDNWDYGYGAGLCYTLDSPGIIAMLQGREEEWHNSHGFFDGALAEANFRLQQLSQIGTFSALRDAVAALPHSRHPGSPRYPTREASIDDPSPPAPVGPPATGPARTAQA